MITPIVNHAMQTVWCEPNQDRYHVFKPWRVSPTVGARGSVRIRHFTVNLPIVGTTNVQPLWHVFHVGKVHQRTLGLGECVSSKWYRLTEAMELNKALIDPYLTNGAIVPKEFCHLRWMEDDSLVMIIQANTVDLGRLIQLGSPEAALYNGAPYSPASEDLYIRFYRNGLFSNLVWPNIAGNQSLPVRVTSQTIFNIANFSQFSSSVNNIVIASNGVGRGLFFKDGFIETMPNVYSSLYLGAHLTYVFDDSIRFIEYHNLSQLGTFLSARDAGKQKYLLLSASEYGSINYLDDVDFYVVRRDAQNKIKGVILNRFMPDAVRQVTHNAWAINTNYVDALCNQHDFLTNRASVQLMVVIRQGGSEERGLPQQLNRIEDLYRLPRAFRLQAMLGINATVPEWRAEALENSAYIRLMGSAFKDLNDELVADAYGYHVLTQAFDPVIYLPDADGIDQVFDVGHALRVSKPAGSGQRAVFLYDENRQLVDVYQNQLTSQVEVIPNGSPTTSVAEAFHAKLSELDNGVIYDSDVDDPDLLHWGFRCYLCIKVGGIPDESWQDVTGNELYYSLTGHVITWNWALLNANNFFPAVRICNTVHFYTVPAPSLVELYTGNMEFEVSAQAEWLGSTVIRRQSIPPAVVDVFLNGRPLIRDLDYVMNWPRVIISRRSTVDPTQTIIQVRSYGACDPVTLLPYPARERGFVKGGVLSVDGHFQVRDDRSCRVVVGGMLFARGEVEYAEDEEITNLITDGVPYAITDYLTQVEPYIDRDTVQMRSAAFDVDTRVSNYLTPRITTFLPELPVVVGDRYRLFSVFLNAIIHEMRFGTLFADEILDIRYGNLEVDAWIAPFTYLFEYDIAYLGFDPEYVIVYPHQFSDPVEVSSIQFSLLRYLIRNYLGGRVELSQSVNIGV